MIVVNAMIHQVMMIHQITLAGIQLVWIVLAYLTDPAQSTHVGTALVLLGMSLSMTLQGVVLAQT